ncbi:MAG: ORF6N domain-containing protein [Bacteroidales bacterium]|nr:ORF6N domain-containing protein [Bacteroidales bacterium]
MEENEIIKSKIRLIRGEQVMLDSDLAELYGVETKNLKRQVRRNAIRFPEDFMFELTPTEFSLLRCQNGTSKERGGNQYLPFAFTASGIAMLSSVLTSETAALANIRIMRAFVAMRKQISELSAQQIQIERLEMKVDRLNDYVESILHDQNEINEEIAMQIELINESIAQLNASHESDKARPKIGFVTSAQRAPNPVLPLEIPRREGQ